MIAVIIQRLKSDIDLVTSHSCEGANAADCVCLVYRYTLALA